MGHGGAAAAGGERLTGPAPCRAFCAVGGAVQDVVRTFPYNQRLSAADQPLVLALTNVLSAYSVRNPVGGLAPAGRRGGMVR